MKRFTATVKNKNIKVHQSKEFAVFMKNFENKDIKLIISEIKDRDIRSVRQNNYYWGVCVPLIAEEMGEEDNNKVHEYLKFKFFSERKQKQTKAGKTYLYYDVHSTTEYNTKEFAEKINEIIKWANDPDDGLCLNIPAPNEDVNAYNINI